MLMQLSSHCFRVLSTRAHLPLQDLYVVLLVFPNLTKLIPIGLGPKCLLHCPLQHQSLLLHRVSARIYILEESWYYFCISIAISASTYNARIAQEITLTIFYFPMKCFSITHAYSLIICCSFEVVFGCEAFFFQVISTST